MAKLYSFNLAASDYITLADKSLKSDIEKSVKYVRKALELEADNIEALQFLGSIYAELGCYDISNKVFLRAYTKAKHEIDKVSIGIGLINNFHELNDFEAAQFYVDTISGNSMQFDDFSDFEVVSDEDEECEFSLAYPRTEEYYYKTLENAHRAMQSKKIDDALKLLSVFEPNVPFYDASNHLKLVCYLLKDDVDRVIYEAEKMLKISDYLPIRCTLITAYMIEEKNSVALKLLDELLLRDYNRVDEITAMLPLLVNFDMHADIVKYTKKLLDLSELQPQTMLWLSQALYNLGQKTEATKVMKRINLIFGEFSPAQFYLSLYKTNPSSVEYSLGLPPTEIEERQNKLKKFLALSNEEAKKALLYDVELYRLLQWSFEEFDGKSSLPIAQKLDMCYSKNVEKLFKERLISRNIGVTLGSYIIASMLRHTGRLDCFICIDGMCREIKMIAPVALLKLPKMFFQAYTTAVFEISSSIDSPSAVLERINKFVNSFSALDDDGNLKWLIANGEKASRFKSFKALLAVFIYLSAHAKEDEINAICKYYRISVATFKMYLKTLSGENDTN